MTTIVNIFGKLYTFLRRPQPEQDAVDEALTLDHAESTSVTGDDASDADKEVSKKLDGTSVGDQKEGPVTKKRDHLEKCMTDSTASSDWEHIPEASSDGQKTDEIETRVKRLDKCTKIPEIQLNGSTLSGTDVDAAYTDSLKVDPLKDSSSKKDNNQGSTIQESGKQTVDEDKGTTGQAEKFRENGSKTDTKSEKEITNARKCKDNKKGKGEKVCKYYKRGQRCWKGNSCKFAHSNEKKHKVYNDAEAVTAKPEKAVDEKDFKSYVDFVCKNSELGSQIEPKDLFYKLGYEKGADLDVVGDAVLGQYQLAKNKNDWTWVSDARYFAELFFAPDWIDRNLPHRDQKSNRKNRPKKKSKYNVNEHFENPSGLCRDFRLKENPDIQKVSANAAGDNSSNNPATGKPSPAQGMEAGSGDSGIKVTGEHTNVDAFVTDYTEQVIHEAMKMAISDGLSESAIMEVIEDVTSAGRKYTPLKRSKLTKLDVARTPRRRPEQLALGFNYHSDLVVQQSPKTVGGEIIPFDTLPQPRERPEQLAVSFNYLADQLVKESPKSETGEVLIPGVISTSRRLARDQLAVGFNYHSDLVVQQSPKTVGGEIIPIDTLPQPRKRPEQLAVSFNYLADQLVKESPKSETGEVIIPGVISTPRRLARDQLAVGFNYHSDVIAKNTPSKRNTNNNAKSSDENYTKNQENEARTSKNRILTANIDNEKLNDPDTKIKSAKRSVSDIFAVGFSYNSDLIIKESLDELNGNVPNDNIVSSLIEDAVIGEGRNAVEVIDEVQATGLPAVSVGK